MLKRKKLQALVMVFLMVFTILVGCSQQTSQEPAEEPTQNQTEEAAENQTEETAEDESAEEVVELSFCMPQTSWGGSAIDPDLMDEVKAVIEEKTNTKIEMLAPPLSSYMEKLNTMLASGQIPDIFYVSKAMDNLQIFASRGYTMPLDDIINEVEGITEVVDPKYFEYMKINGEIHGLPRYVPMSKIIWMRKDLMEEYGVNLSATPTTEEFYNEMKKLTDSDVIPFCFPKWLDNLTFFYNAFGGYGGIAMDENGKYYDGFNTPETKEALAYIRKLYEEGIWDQEFITNENSTMREKLITGQAASNLDYFNRFIYYISESHKQDAGTEFVPIYELKGPNGGGGNLNEAIQVAIAISSKCEEPKRAVEVANWFFYTEEGNRLGLLGIEGKHYTIENEQLVPTEKAANSGYNSSVSNFFLSYSPLPDFEFKWDETTEEYLDEQVAIVEEVQNHLGPKYLIPGGKSDLYDRNQPSYKKKIEEIASKIIMGGVTLEEGYEEYEAFWKSIDGDKMLEELNN